MKKLPVLALFLFVAAIAAQQSSVGPSAFDGKEPNGRNTAGRQPVLLELFTAEGCPSCPAAEKNLAFLQTEQPYREAEIVTLAFHVDYWDGEGWKDPFASPLFTQRQRVYDRKFRTGNIYTPQMVVDGDIEFIGSKLDKAEKAVARALRNEKADVRLSIDGDKLKIEIRNIPEADISSVYLAIAEDGLSSDVRRGENAGKTLNHVSVTRSLTGVGRLLPGQRSFDLETVIGIDPGWGRGRLKAVVFIQENHTRKIQGVGYVRFGEM